MADSKVSALTAATSATSDDLFYLIDGATTSKKITFANVEGSIDHDNLTNTHNLTTDIDHDSLSGFVANEHIDWTTDQGATNIHSGNYTNTTYSAGTGITLTGTTFSTNDGAIDHDSLLNFTTAEHFTMLDEDDMASDSATQCATQQSIKKYVDDSILLKSGINFIIDGGGSTITTGIKGDLRIPYGCTINKVTLLADASGSIAVDIWKDTYANFPPTDADSITASAVPTITSATKSEDSTLTGWTTSITAGDILRFNVDSITTCKRVTLVLDVTRT